MFYLLLIHKLTFLDERCQQSAFSYQQKILKAKAWLTADRLSALRLVDEPLGHELEAEWLKSSRSRPMG